MTRSAGATGATGGPARRARPDRRPDARRRWRERRTVRRRLGRELRDRAGGAERNSRRGSGPGPRAAPRRDRRPRRTRFADSPRVLSPGRRARGLHGRQDGALPEAGRRGDCRGERQAGGALAELGRRHSCLAGHGRRLGAGTSGSTTGDARPAPTRRGSRRPRPPTGDRAAGERRCDGLRTDAVAPDEGGGGIA